jgi:isocitrate/isopropylmalate dehydrogenase
MAPSANLHPGRHALYEPVHGSAPDIAGQNRANPMGAIACAGLILGQLGVSEAADAVDRALRGAVAAGVTTPDLDGDRTTEQVGAWVADALGS